jgi:hypothetical protein
VNQTYYDKLRTCHPDLIRLMLEVDKVSPGIIIACGFRGETEQNAAYARGASGVKWPHGAHNKTPSRAVDAYPPNYPFTGSSKVQVAMCTDFQAQVRKIAEGLGIKLRPIIKARGAPDLPHYELEQEIT